MELIRFSSSTLNRLSFCGRGTTINHIPDDLLIEIFLRLPLKSAKRCTSVSKHWYALISTPNFANRFLQLHYISTLLLSCEDDTIEIKIRKLFYSSEDSTFRSDSFSLTYLPFEPEAEPPTVIASCRDLLLCCCPSFGSHSDYFLCNPLTSKWIQLPPTPAPYHSRGRFGFIFQGQGICFKYAVVRLEIFRDQVTLHIFTSDSANWSKKVWTLCPLIGRNLQNTFGVPYEGSLFWITKSYSDLVSIDPFHEGGSFRVIPLPNAPSLNVPAFRQKEDDVENALLCVCGGTLRLIETTSNEEDDVLFICVWDLKSLGEKREWNLEHFNLFSGLMSDNPTWYSDLEFDVHPVACDPNNGAIVYLMIEEKILLSYDMHMETLDVIYDVLNTKVYLHHRLITYAVPWQPTSLPS